MPISTLANFKTFARVETPSVDDVFLQAALDAAESTVRSLTGRYLVVAGAATARTFVPDESAILRFQDCTSVTSIVDNGTTLVANTDYQLEPINGLNVAGETVPFTQARRLNGTWSSTVAGKASIAVTAAWGWAAIPGWAVQATLLHARDIAMSRDLDKIITPMVAAILAPHRRVESWGIA